MHVTCPSCKFGGTVRDDQIPPDGKEVYCPNCNIRFRIRKSQASPTAARYVQEKAATWQADPSDYFPISCPVCGLKGKLRRSAVAAGQSKRFTCPSCKNPFTFTPSGADPPLRDDTVLTDTSVDTPSLCPDCGSKIARTLPICPNCGKILTGIRIYCPSCKSANVGISDKARDDAGPQWETMVFRPVSLAAAKPADILIPLLCRDCGKTWMIKPALIQVNNESSGLPQGQG